MTFNHVAVNQRSVTGIEFFRHAVLALEFGKGFAEENFLFNYEAIFLQMADPAIATVSRRRLVDGFDCDCTIPAAQSCRTKASVNE
jgi:hypothetical protein